MRLPLTRRSKTPTPEPQPLARAATADDLTAIRAHRNLLVTFDGTYAWFLLGEVDWLFRSPTEREELLTAATSRYADLTGRRIVLRVTSAPFNRRAWVDRIGRDFPPGKRLADVPGSTTMDDVLDAGQELILDLGARATAAFIAVRVTEQQLDEDSLRAVRSPVPLTDRHAGLEETRQALRDVTVAVSRPGFAATPVSSSALGWLVHSSVGLGLPVPPVLLGARSDGWVDDELAGFTAGVTTYASPYAATTTVRAVRGGEPTESHVSVLHAVSFEPRVNIAGGGWLSWFQTLPYGVDVLAVFDIVPPAQIRETAEKERRLADDIIGHYAEHGDTPPARRIRARARAAEIEDEVTVGGRLAARARGVVMVAVTGPTEDDALVVANDLASLAAEQGITLVQGIDQYHSARAFIPGEPAAMHGYITRQPIEFLAAGVVNASTRAGDGTGFLIGSVAGGHDVMLLDPWGGSARDDSNLRVVGGRPGTGKSSLGGALLDWSARCGVHTIGLDPSGQWNRLVELPHLKGEARALDLFTARRGVLTPSVLIVDPDPGDYPTEKAYAAAVEDARYERADLTVDTLRDLLPFALVNGDTDGSVSAIIEDAVAAVGKDFGADPWEIVDRISRAGEKGARLASILTTRAGMRDGALIFPDRTAGVDAAQVDRELDRATLTIITLKGLALPPKDNPHRATWTRQQQAAVPVLNLSSRLAIRAMYADRKTRTSIQIDELSLVTGGSGGSFGPFMARASVDSRKWNTDVGLYFQNPRMLLDIDPEIGNLIGSAWVGKMSEEAAAAAVPMLRVDPGLGVEKTIAGLEQGEFVVRDWVGRVRKVRVDRGWWDAGMLAAVDTNPHGEGTYDASGLPGIFDEEATA